MNHYKPMDHYGYGPCCPALYPKNEYSFWVVLPFLSILHCPECMMPGSGVWIWIWDMSQKKGWGNKWCLSCMSLKWDSYVLIWTSLSKWKCLKILVSFLKEQLPSILLKTCNKTIVCFLYCFVYAQRQGDIIPMIRGSIRWETMWTMVKILKLFTLRYNR